MSLTSALSSALSGLRATQLQMEVISGNVANSDTTGYTRRSASLVEGVANGDVNGVRTLGVNRMLDAILQRELRTETSGSGYATMRANVLDSLQRLFGTPGGDYSLDTLFNGFTKALQGLADNPSSSIDRQAVLRAADTLAGAIRTVSDGVQQLRSDAEEAIGQRVRTVNDLLEGIAKADQRVAASQGAEPAYLDQRDGLINELAKYVDVRVQQNPNGTVSLSTTAGTRLYDASGPSTLAFDGRGGLGATNLYSGGSQRGVGALTVTAPGGAPVDVTPAGMLRSGELGALLELRDRTLVDAQNVLDSFAAGLSAAISNRIVTGTAGGGGGTDIDLTGIQNGNRVTIDYTLTPSGAARRITLVSQPGGVIPANVTPDPNDVEIGVDFSGGMAAAATAIQTRLTSLGVTNVTVTATATGLNVADDGGAGTSDIAGVTASITNASSTLTGQGPEFALFVDNRAGQPFTGSFVGGSQIQGFAARIAVNPAAVADPSRLSVYSTSPQTPAGDATRPRLMLDRLTSVSFDFAAGGGVGGPGAPVNATVRGFLAQVVQAQASNAESAKRLDEGQKVVQSAIESRFAKASGVSVDEELAKLIQVQNAYAANARLMTAAKEMMDLLMRM